MHGNDPEPIPEPDVPLLHCWHEVARSHSHATDKCCWCGFSRPYLIACTMPVPGHGEYVFLRQALADEDTQPKPFEDAACPARRSNA